MRAAASEYHEALRSGSAMCLRLTAAHQLAINADLPLAFIIATASAKQEACQMFDMLVLRYLRSLGRQQPTHHATR